MKWFANWRLKIGIFVFLATLSASRMRELSSPQLLIIAQNRNLSALVALAQSVGFKSTSLPLKPFLKTAEITQYKNIVLIADDMQTLGIQQNALIHIWPRMRFITLQQPHLTHTDTYQLKMVQEELNRLYNSITKGSQRTPPLPLIFSAQYIQARKKLSDSLIKDNIMQLKRHRKV